MREMIITNPTMKPTMRHLKLSLVTMVCGLFFHSSVFAVGFGDPLVRSYLGQPLNVQVPISGVPQSDLNASCIHASVKTMNGDHIANPHMEFVPPKLTSPSEQSNSATLVNFLTKESVVEPAVTLSIALKCGPLMQRTYSLLLDYADMPSPVAILSPNPSAESATPVPLVAKLTEPAPARSTASASTKRAKSTKAGSGAKKPGAQSTVKPKIAIRAKLPAKASSPTDQLNQ